VKYRIVKPQVASIALIFTGIGIGLPILCFLFGELWYGLIFLVVWLWGFGGALIQCLVKKVVIGDRGVEYISLIRHYEMSWADIKIIGIGYIPIKAPGRQPWIYFAADGISCPMLNARMINEKFFMVSYRYEIVIEIKKYWQNEIDGLYSESDFEKRVNKKKGFRP